MLDIDHLAVSVGDHPVLHDLHLQVRAGEVHAIMGPNGAGKSSLTRVVAGHPAYRITSGSIRFQGEDLAGVPPEERSTRGVFIGFQYPVEVPGVNNRDFLRLAANAAARARGLPEYTAASFAPVLAAAMAEVGMDAQLADRDLNSGFSGGQKKRNEILQMLVLQPRLAILDETDSGLDVDALRAVAQGIDRYRHPERAIILITHYQRLLDLVRPDHVHVLAAGRLIRSGGADLARQIEERGYDWLAPSPAAPGPGAAHG